MRRYRKSYHRKRYTNRGYRRYRRSQSGNDTGLARLAAGGVIGAIKVGIKADRAINTAGRVSYRLARGSYRMARGAWRLFRR